MSPFFILVPCPLHLPLASIPNLRQVLLRTLSLKPLQGDDLINFAQVFSFAKSLEPLNVLVWTAFTNFEDFCPHL